MFPRVLLARLLSVFQRKRHYKGLRGRGQAWERVAKKRLEAEGYEILERNFVTNVGEIDFIAREAGTLCFVEVKGRESAAFGAPAEAVTMEKQRRIFRAAESYLQRNRIGETPCRFDVVSILGSGKDAEISIIRDAFRGPLPSRVRR
ncbi:MAG TPA: YraN family protein [Thermoanaerobaculia bacterium]